MCDIFFFVCLFCFCGLNMKNRGFAIQFRIESQQHINIGNIQDFSQQHQLFQSEAVNVYLFSHLIRFCTEIEAS